MVGDEDERWATDTKRGAVVIHRPTAHGARLPAASLVAVDAIDGG